MRISDWSSDVCSSDLMGAWLRGGPGDGMQRPFLLFRFGDEAADRDVHRLEGRVDRRALGQRRPALAADELVERRLLQIGRASWRERVCPYLYISVVALSLKKKKQSNSL